MKLLLVTPYYFPVKGGITTYVNGLYETFVNKPRMDVKIITMEGKSTENVTVIKGNKYTFMSKMLLSLFEEKPRIIHVHSHWYLLNPVLWYKRYHPKTRIIFTFHTELSKMLEGIKKRKFSNMLSKCDIVTFVSENLRHTIEKNLDIETDKRVIYAGVRTDEVEEDREKIKAEYQLEENKPILSFIGPLEYQRKIEGIRRLIGSIIRLREKYPSIKLIIIGDGKYRKELEEVSKEHGVEDLIIFTGYIDNVFPLLAITDIYMHISLQEGFPIAILEAMSYRKPIITTETGGIPEIITNNENGLIVKPTSESIVDAVIDLYEDKEKMKEMGVNSRKMIEEKYSWDRIAKEFLNAYGVTNVR